MMPNEGAGHKQQPTVDKRQTTTDTQHNRQKAVDSRTRRQSVVR